jgi:branched-chain amino acid transport system ATP-binding protein
LTLAAASSAPLLEVAAIAKHFGGVAAVSDLSMLVRTGSVAGLMGPNGAGKTTLVNLISGLLPSDSGTIRFGGAEIQRSPAYDIAAQGIARTYQNVRLFSGMTVLEQVMAGCYVRRGASLWASFLGLPKARAAHKAVEHHALELLERVQLSDQAHLLAETLSYGEQRRVEIARALGTSPRLLLPDEPTAGMNVQESNEIGNLGTACATAALTVLMVEHNVRLVKEFCDHVTVMNFGRLLATGTPEECIAHPDVQAAYFGNTADAERIGLCASYGAIRAVTDLGFEVGANGMVAILGANGAGKSTTAAHRRPASAGAGSIKLDGERSRRCRSIASCGLALVPRAHDRRPAHGRGEPEAQQLRRSRQPARPDGARPRPVPAPPEAWPGGGPDERRRTADARHRPGPDDRAAHAGARRAVDGPGAGDRRSGVPGDRHPASPGPVDPAGRAERRDRAVGLRLRLPDEARVDRHEWHGGAPAPMPACSRRIWRKTTGVYASRPPAAPWR